MTTRISNPSRDPFASDVLKAVADQAERDSGVASERVTSADVGTKGLIIEAIGVGILSNAAWDMLKLAVRRLRHRSDYRPDVTVSVNGTEVELRFLEDPDATVG